MLPGPARDERGLSVQFRIGDGCNQDKGCAALKAPIQRRVRVRKLELALAYLFAGASDEHGQRISSDHEKSFPWHFRKRGGQFHCAASRTRVKIRMALRVLRR